MNYDHLTHNQLVQAIDNLAERCERLERDAARYNAIRNNPEGPWYVPHPNHSHLMVVAGGEKLDRAVDSELNNVRT